jgi:1,4-alpha-glucan branching enzyme
LLGKMPGDDWRRFANLRLLFGYMFAQPGKKLLFMGSELAQVAEWNHEASLEWHLLEHTPHAGVLHWIRDLNTAYRRHPALHELDFQPEGFEWVDASDTLNCVVSFVRRSSTAETVLVVSNFTPVPRFGYRVGVPEGGEWVELLNSDAAVYGGSGSGNLGRVVAGPEAMHGRPWSLNLTLPPLAVVMFTRHAREKEGA